MRLLILTQKIDIHDPILGFFHRWVEEFANNCEKVTVICLQKGQFNLPENVKILSLGKENGESRLKYLINFYKYIWSERKNYDSVFVHMNPIYLVWGGIFWKIFGKKTSLWYTHKNIDLKLKIAVKFSDVIFSASKESFRMMTKKLQIVGHGIPVESFRNTQNFSHDLTNKFRMISVGRITKIKNLDVLIRACAILKKKNLKFETCLIGPVVGKDDEKYLKYLNELISENDLSQEIKFIGSVSNDRIAQYNWYCDLSINLAPTGGVDKAVLESMASGSLVLASNLAFEEYFGKYKDILMFKEGDEKDLADKIMNLVSRNDTKSIRSFLQFSVKEKTDLVVLVLKIISKIS
ncbi:MAG: glycosyltransferase [Minisyncoccia bacterium]